MARRKKPKIKSVRPRRIGKKKGGANFIVWLEDEGIYGRKGQITITLPDGRKMSVTAAAKECGISPRTLAHRVASKPKELWFEKRHLRRKPSATTNPAKTISATVFKNIKGIYKPDPYANPIGLQRAKGRYSAGSSKRLEGPINQRIVKRRKMSGLTPELAQPAELARPPEE